MGEGEGWWGEGGKEEPADKPNFFDSNYVHQMDVVFDWLRSKNHSSRQGARRTFTTWCHFIVISHLENCLNTVLSKLESSGFMFSS